MDMIIIKRAMVIYVTCQYIYDANIVNVAIFCTCAYLWPLISEVLLQNLVPLPICLLQRLCSAVVRRSGCECCRSMRVTGGAPNSCIKRVILTEKPHGTNSHGDQSTCTLLRQRWISTGNTRHTKNEKKI